jgi:hypothetical protein
MSNSSIKCPFHFIYVPLVHKQNKKKKTEVLPLVSYYELEQDCQILECQNYNVVSPISATTVILAPIIRINAQIKSGFGK